MKRLTRRTLIALSVALGICSVTGDERAGRGLRERAGPSWTRGPIGAGERYARGREDVPRQGEVRDAVRPRSATQFAESNGFRKWDPKAAAGLKPGTRWYAINRDRTIVLFVVGTEPIENGLRIVNTHIDSPRIEFKTKPFRESQQAVLIDTQVHGGIKNYQWANVPLAITGRVDKADGTTAWIDIGNDPARPGAAHHRSGAAR